LIFGALIFGVDGGSINAHCWCVAEKLNNYYLNIFKEKKKASIKFVTQTVSRPPFFKTIKNDHFKLKLAYRLKVRNKLYILLLLFYFLKKRRYANYI
jgi:hypothetical protein